jgi:two-component system, chemotaxis family, response regulator Rcp1
MGTTREHIVEILLIEDNEGDIRFMKEALKETSFRANLNEICDGEAAIDYLKKMGADPNIPKPDMILLDLNLPKRNGHEVLQFLKSQKNLKSIPVAILTSATSEEDITKAYKFMPSGYIAKQADCKVLGKEIECLWGFTSLKRKRFRQANKLNMNNGK